MIYTSVEEESFSTDFLNWVNASSWLSSMLFGSELLRTQRLANRNRVRERERGFDVDVHFSQQIIKNERKDRCVARTHAHGKVGWEKVNSFDDVDVDGNLETTKVQKQTNDCVLVS